MCASFHVDFWGGMWDLIVLVPDHYLSFYLPEIIEERARVHAECLYFTEQLLLLFFNFYLKSLFS